MCPDPIGASHPSCHSPGCGTARVPDEHGRLQRALFELQRFLRRSHGRFGELRRMRNSVQPTQRRGTLFREHLRHQRLPRGIR